MTFSNDSWGWTGFPPFRGGAINTKWDLNQSADPVFFVPARRFTRRIFTPPVLGSLVGRADYLPLDAAVCGGSVIIFSLPSDPRESAFVS